jgi:hypothetical protein
MNFDDNKFIKEFSMKILKILSILGLVWYFVWFIFAILTPNDKEQTIPILAGLASVAFFFYAAFHAIIACLQGIKNKNTLLKITSIISCVLLGLLGFFSILTAAGLADGNAEDYTRQAALLGILVFSIPVAIALSIIAMLQVSKVLKQNTLIEKV